jgi:hypothetical protein
MDSTDLSKFQALVPYLREQVAAAINDPETAGCRHVDTSGGYIMYSEIVPHHLFRAQGVVKFLYNFELNNKEIILIKPHKTGSTTLNNVLNCNFPHLDPLVIRTLVTDEEWNAAKKICFVRNTYDRLVSWFLNTTKLSVSPGNIALTEAVRKFYENYGIQYGQSRHDGNLERKFIKEGFRNWIKDSAPLSPRKTIGIDLAPEHRARFDEELARHDIKWVTEISNLPLNYLNQMMWIMDDDNKTHPDFIGRFENLEQDIKKVTELLGREPPTEIPHLNKSINRLPYQEYYDDESVEKVNEMFQEEIDYFGFKF